MKQDIKELKEVSDVLQSQCIESFGEEQFWKAFKDVKKAWEVYLLRGWERKWA